MLIIKNYKFETQSCFFFVETHSIHRKIALNEKIQNEINRQLRIQIRFSKCQFIDLIDLICFFFANRIFQNLIKSLNDRSRHRLNT